MLSSCRSCFRALESQSYHSLLLSREYHSYHPFTTPHSENRYGIALPTSERRIGIVLEWCNNNVKELLREHPISMATRTGVTLFMKIAKSTSCLRVFFSDGSYHS